MMRARRFEGTTGSSQQGNFRRILRRLPALAGLVAVGIGVSATASPAAQLPTSHPNVVTTTCTPLGSTGLTAKLVVTKTSLTGATVTAAGCDVGIYVPQGNSTLTISHVTVTGAKDEGILVQNSANITVSDSTVIGNGIDPTPAIAFDNALELTFRMWRGPFTSPSLRLARRGGSRPHPALPTAP